MFFCKLNVASLQNEQSFSQDPVDDADLSSGLSSEDEGDPPSFGSSELGQV